ncbi:MAG: GDP-mannose 4,6-dehydratase [Ilumatobacteraceae bacterium]
MTADPLASSFSGRRVLVTGGMGFIGSHLVEALVTSGALVRVLGRYNSTSSIGHLVELDPALRSRIEIRHGDVVDRGSVDEAVRDVDTVFHLAALIGIPYSYVAPGQYVATNVVGTMNVLDAVRRHGVRRLVHTSTSETFGSAQYVPMDESHPLNAQSPYAATKAAADQLCLSYYASFETPVVVLRPFNTFGPRQSLRAIIPTVISQLLRGPRVAVGNTDTIRDMNPVWNTVDAFIQAAATGGVEGQTFVVGSGQACSISDIIDAVASHIGVKPEVVVESSRVRPQGSEVDRLLCDFSRAATVLGYQPRVSFEEGLAATVEWMRGRSEDGRDYVV